MKKYAQELGGDFIGNPLRTHVFKELEQAIIDGVIEPGTSLAEQKISKQLGVSRTPVREALMQLELEGLVETIPGKGAVVIGVTDSDIDDIYTIRVRIEGLASRRAAEMITDKELKVLEEVVELQEFYVSRNDFMQVWHLDTRFHEYLYQCSRSRPLKQILTLFHNYIQKARELTVRSGRAADSTMEHRRIVNALRAHDPDEAETAMAEHVTNARDSFFNQMR